MFVSEGRPLDRTQATLLAGSGCLKLGYGRFMQTDPLGYDDGLNWYNYVGGDPVNGTDPSGTCESTVSGVTYTWHYAHSTSCTTSSAQLSEGINAYNIGDPGDIRVVGYLPQSGTVSYGSSQNQGGTSFMRGESVPSSLPAKSPAPVPIRSKKYICSKLSTNGYNVLNAWGSANADRKSKTGGRSNWNNPIFREGENWLTAASGDFYLPFAWTLQV